MGCLNSQHITFVIYIIPTCLLSSHLEKYVAIILNDFDGIASFKNSKHMLLHFLLYFSKTYTIHDHQLSLSLCSMLEAPLVLMSREISDLEMNSIYSKTFNSCFQKRGKKSKTKQQQKKKPGTFKF